MQLYVVSLGAGLLVGVIYSLLDVRSPAPPMVALVGLLGILIGEQIVPVGKQLLAGKAFASACDKTHTVKHIFGHLPGRHVPQAQKTSKENG
ncbi:XapX domain-containing protein [Bradyrhizobium yuanmingense]|uniref:XapX domain-containing protein n=1 Tax=Bradyrhizobium yuanmingense TaxID=108015 RepID=UPI0023B8957E|nr:XapX domain-containing protein [Bradyrhizobium yuanmingense]MDF0492240.1 XapX domain-containing protein [Bradyrhizobium yuanmingense]